MMKLILSLLLVSNLTFAMNAVELQKKALQIEGNISDLKEKLRAEKQKWLDLMIANIGIDPGGCDTLSDVLKKAGSIKQ